MSCFSTQAMMQMQQSMNTLQSAGFMPPGMGGFSPYAGAAANPVGGLNFSSLLGGPAGAAPGTTFTPPAAVDPAVRFAAQQQQLQDMGFTDQAANLRALQATSGNVNAAVERLLNGM